MGGTGGWMWFLLPASLLVLVLLVVAINRVTKK
jgi:heme exporter protein D